MKPIGRYLPLSSIAFKNGEYWDTLSAATGCWRHRLMKGVNRSKRIELIRDRRLPMILRGDIMVEDDSWVIIVSSSLLLLSSSLCLIRSMPSVVSMELFSGDDELSMSNAASASIMLELEDVASVVVVVAMIFVVETKVSVEIIRILDSSERGFRVVVGLVSATAVGL